MPVARVPERPGIYHITHVDNLAEIVRQGALWSDAKRIELGLVSQVVGITDIKRSRLKLPVKCHPGTNVGEYVPFYFCPRSIMLYILHMGNRQGLTYRGGQAPMLHLAADMRAAVAWAEAQARRWAFSNCNAGARYAQFLRDLSLLGEVDWRAVHSTDFRQADVKEGKQAEFLVYESFPWELIGEIGVHDLSIERRVHALLRDATHQPAVRVVTDWYF